MSGNAAPLSQAHHRYGEWRGGGSRLLCGAGLRFPVAAPSSKFIMPFIKDAYSRIKAGGRFEPSCREHCLATRVGTSTKAAGFSSFCCDRWSYYPVAPHGATGLKVYLRGAPRGQRHNFTVVKGVQPVWQRENRSVSK